VHSSAFELGLEGFAEQTELVVTGTAAIVERACQERTPIVVEGVHVVPGTLEPELLGRCVAVEAMLVVSDEELHRGHFSLRGAARPAERYLARFAEIRALQDHLTERAHAEGIAVIENRGADDALQRLMELVLDTAGERQDTLG
jgi:2-phosphoglycerate kinase